MPLISALISSGGLILGSVIELVVVGILINSH